MATSPIYGWAEPDNTDLVKNGALAIRTLGNSIDTTMGTMTPKSTFTAKGSIAAATAASTPANLAVGNNGEALVADSSTATGLRYQTGYNGNAIINGGMDIWQRGTSLTSTTANPSFGADRWNCYNGRTGTTYSRQSSGLTGFQYSMRAQRDSGNAATGTLYTVTTLETADSLRFAGQAVTISFYAKAGANFSATANALSYGLSYGTGTDQSFWSFTGSTTAISTSAALTTGWQRFQATATVSASATELAIIFQANPTGTAGANDWFEITGVQLELGSVASSFKRAGGGTIQGELAACQRYYQKSYPQGNAPAINVNTTFGSGVGIDFGLVAQVPVTGIAGTTRGKALPKPFAVTMRTTPTVRFWDSLGNLSKYSAYDANTSYISANNSFDAFGGVAPYDFTISFQTVAASSTHIYCVILWEASAEL